MNRSPVKTILLPSILTSATVFCVMAAQMVPGKIRQPDEAAPLPSERLQLVMLKEQKNLAIRNVGLCILASVGTGLLVAEAIRKFQSACKQAYLKQETIAKPIEEFLCSEPEEDFILHSQMPLLSSVELSGFNNPLEDVEPLQKEWKEADDAVSSGISDNRPVRKAVSLSQYSLADV